MLWDTMWSFLKSWFNYPGVNWELMLVAIGLAVAFGAVWLLGYWPPIFKKIWFWPVMVAAAFLTMLAITFAQIPLQYYSGQALGHFWDQKTLVDWYFLTGIPTVLISGLVQEAVKSLPVAVWWWRSGRTLTPKMGLIIGAVAGAGFGIFEAVWDNGSNFAAGWTTQFISQYGFDAFFTFWTRFFSVGFHIAASALVGYGLAKGKWWQYFLITAVLHGLLNYATVILSYFIYVNNAAWFRLVYIDIYVAVIAVAVMVWALILRWRKDREEPLPPIEVPVEQMPPAVSIPPSVDMGTPPGAGA